MAVAKNPGKRTNSKKAVPETEKYLCHCCLKKKGKSQFYANTNPMILSGITHVCKDCVRKIALAWDDNRKEFGACTKSSVMEAIELIDRPYLDSVWDASYNEWANTESQKRRTTIWDAYIKNIAMPQYRGLRWRDGDLFTTYVEDAKKNAEIEIAIDEKKASPREQEALEESEINRKDIIRMIGYDPFMNYPIDADKPVLYAQLISFIDDETKNDGMKMNAVIQIVKSFNQIQKINDAIDELSASTQKLNINNGTIKQLADTVSKLLSGANALAKDNGINSLVPSWSDLRDKPIELLETLKVKVTTTWIERSGVKV